MTFTFTRSYKGSVCLVCFDLAGTVVDYGCQAPAAAFVEAFYAHGVEISIATARGPMGMEKREHIKTIAHMPEVSAAWIKAHGKAVTKADINTIYHSFADLLMQQIEARSTLLPGVMEAVAALRAQDIKVGAGTGYFQEAADIVLNQAARQGFCPDFSTCASLVSAGRPAPWMIYATMEKLGIYPPEAIVHVGDTPVDIESGLNAGVWSVGVAATSNEMGLTQEECSALPQQEYAVRLNKVHQCLTQAGAHWVIDSMHELPGVVEKINTRLALGQKP